MTYDCYYKMNYAIDITRKDNLLLDRYLQSYCDKIFLGNVDIPRMCTLTDEYYTQSIYRVIIKHLRDNIMVIARVTEETAVLSIDNLPDTIRYLRVYLSFAKGNRVMT